MNVRQKHDLMEALDAAVGDEVGAARHQAAMAWLVAAHAAYRTMGLALEANQVDNMSTFLVVNGYDALVETAGIPCAA